MIEVTAMIAAGAPVDVRGEHEVQAGDAVGEAREHVLQRVGAVQILCQRHAEHASSRMPCAAPK